MLLPLLAATALGFAGGLLGGATFAGARTPPSAAAGTDLGPLLAAIEGLRRDLAPVVASPASRPPMQRTEVAPSPSEPTALATVVADLVRAVEELTARAGVLGAQQAAAGGMLQQLAQRSGHDAAALAAVARAVRDDYERMQAEWMFVPATELLRRLGRPTRITAGKGAGVQWNYEFGPETDTGWLGFTVVDGVVVRVD